MSLLSALVRAYDRLPDAPPFGYSTEKIGFCVVLEPDGAVAEVVDLRATDRKRSPKPLLVPQAVKRTAGIAPNFLWDKTAYVLGVTAGEGRRTAEEHAAFRAKHLDWLAGANDEGIVALRRFLEGWTAGQFAAPIWPEDLRDQNIVFRLANELAFLHDRPAARELWRRIGAEGVSDAQTCLVTGESAPVARLHPSIKGVWGAQSSGASLVSFNLDAFTSYGHDQGDNAPVSEAAAFAYTTALNRFLADPRHRLQIGDASTVFWADAADSASAKETEALFPGLFENKFDDDDSLFAARVRERLAAIREGRRLAEIAPDLAQGVRFYVLGLAPNAARLSVRFWWESDFGTLTGNYQRFLRDTAIEPAPRDGWPPLWRYLVELAVLGKRENVPPLIAGEWMRAILTAAAYPLSLLSTTLMRIRSDGEVNALRAAMLKSVLIRNFHYDEKEAPVALDPDSKDTGYVLGRLFAAYENVQKAALGKSVNATIRDKFYSSASATPARVFGSLAGNAFNHLAKVRKEQPAFAHFLQDELQQIANLLDVSTNPFPSALSQESQAKFALGYYHQASYRKPAEPAQDQESHAEEPSQ